MLLLGRRDEGDVNAATEGNLVAPGVSGAPLKDCSDGLGSRLRSAGLNCEVVRCVASLLLTRSRTRRKRFGDFDSPAAEASVVEVPMMTMMYYIWGRRQR